MSKEVIAIDLGGTHTRFAKVKNGRISGFVEKKTPSKRKDILNLLETQINSLKSKNTKGLGISFAGIVSNGKIVRAPNVDLENLNLRNHLKNKLGLRVEIENDSNCFALDEINRGTKKKNFAVITLGTGIGGGIVINRSLYKGRSAAGEFGHIILNRNKEWEYWYQKSDLKKEAEYLGQGIANITSILDPEEIIIDGGAKKTGKKFLENIRKHADKYKFVKKLPSIKYSRLKNSGIRGAASLIR